MGAVEIEAVGSTPACPTSGHRLLACGAIVLVKGAREKKIFGSGVRACNFVQYRWCAASWCTSHARRALAQLASGDRSCSRCFCSAGSYISHSCVAVEHFQVVARARRGCHVRKYFPLEHNLVEWKKKSTERRHLLIRRQTP